METSIAVTGLHKIYGKNGSAIEAVKELTLSVRKGEIFGFLGPNGAGKTTSLKMIVGLLQPTRGQVEILGIDPSTQKKKLKSQLGIIPQDISIYEELTVLENLLFMSRLYRLPKDKALKRVHLLIKMMGLEDKKNAPAKILSGGQKRRLNLIMGIIHDPEIILCDEPTPGLDPQSRILVWNFIYNLAKKDGKTVVLTTHFMEEADRLCDRVAIIDNGKVLVLDTPENLKTAIGEGDLLELTINNKNKLEKVKAVIAEFSGVQEIRMEKSSPNGDLVLRCLDVVPKLSKLLNLLGEQDVEVTNMRIRNASLEDVFIHLTGRNLRD